MLEKRLTLFRLLGFEVRIDASWLILALLIVWTLARGYFPYAYEGLPEATYWLMAVGGLAGLFCSIVIHELSHSVIARREGIEMKGITLFIFGGVAEMDREPPSPRAEFRMAIAGPIASVALAVLFYLGAVGVEASGRAPAVAAVLGYLAMINAVLAGFNLVPAFPLDGGRVFRAMLWGRGKSLREATRMAADSGSAFGLVLTMLGVMSFIAGNVVGGIWWVLIGMFLRGASRMSYEQMTLREALEGEPISRFMHRDPVTVSSATTIQELVDDYIYKLQHRMFPVVDGGRLVGCVQARGLKDVPREEWPFRTVAEVLAPCSGDNTLSPDTDSMKALALMKGSGNSRFVVAEDGRVLGVVTLRDLLNFLSIRLDLEAPADRRAFVELDKGTGGGTDEARIHSHRDV